MAITVGALHQLSCRPGLEKFLRSTYMRYVGMLQQEGDDYERS
jgi:hypothetical protein